MPTTTAAIFRSCTRHRYARVCRCCSTETFATRTATRTCASISSSTCTTTTALLLATCGLLALAERATNLTTLPALLALLPSPAERTTTTGRVSIHSVWIQPSVDCRSPNGSHTHASEKARARTPTAATVTSLSRTQPRTLRSS